jgi:thioester reductase-like protein/FkbH-like protein
VWSPARGSAANRTPDNLAELLELRAASHPDEGYSFLLGADVDGPRAELSYLQLFTRARELAAMLDAAGARGERVVLVFAPGLEFIVGLFGCMLAGAIAVPVYPPNPSRLYKTLPLLEAIAADCEARFALTSPDLMQMNGAVAQLSEGLAKITWLSTAAEGNSGSSWSGPKITPDQLAFLQYTSGSTGEPKGVMLSHANLLCNEAMIAAGMGHGASTRVVGWLPLYHDMGLIGNVLNPLWVGTSALLMSPITFIKRPMVWLEAISSFGAHTSGGPNFAYDLCVERIEPGVLERIDLSRWVVAYNGAEPVRRATIDRFANAFAPAGFDRRALFPCYGLAEATLAVTATTIDLAPRVLEVDRNALEGGRVEPHHDDEPLSLVSSGRPLPGCEVAIIDPELLTITSDARVGEICVRGDSIARGYWGRPVLSRATFELELIGDAGGPWLRTGDLGFVDGGELFVCGRRKDLLIVRGRNLHPHDLERAISDAHSRVRPGCVAAFATEHDDNEEIVIIAEIRESTAADRLDEIARTTREVLSDGFGVRPLEVVLVQPHSLPKTSSGKLRRSATRELWRTGRLERLAHVDRGPTRAEAEPPRDIVEARVLEICAEVLEVPQLTREDDFFKLGADSVAIATMTARLEVVLGREIPLGAVFDSPSVAGLAAWLRADGYDTTQLRPRELPLTPDMQRLLGASATIGANQRNTNGGRTGNAQSELPLDTLHLAAAFTLRGAASVEDLAGALETALQNFATRHAALRTNFAPDEHGQIKQQIHARVVLGLERRTLTKLDEIEATYAEFVRRPFTLEHPPLWRFCLVEIAGGEPALCVAAHHLVSDHASFRTLVSELEAELGGDARSLGSPDDSAVVRLAHGERSLDAHAADSLSGIEPLSFAAIAGRAPDAGYAAGSLFVELDPATHAGLDALARTLGVLPAALGFAVLQILLHRICGVDRFVVGVPVDQRIALGTPDAVGYFGVPVPVACEVHASDTPRVLARRTHGQLRRVMDHPGLPATLSATLERALGRCPGVPLLQVLFNVLPASERRGPIRGPTLQRLPLGSVSMDIDVSLALVRGQSGGAIELHHRLDVLDAAGARALVDAYVELLSNLARDIDTPLSQQVYPPSCPPAPLRRRIALASTFTADPLIPIIVGWGRLFECPFEVEPSPYGQVIQPLLDPASPLRSEDVVARVLLVRLVDVFRARREQPSIDDYQDWCADLLDAVREAASAGLTIIALAPSDAGGELADLELELGEGLAAISGVRVIWPDAMLAGLEVETAFDPQADALAHVPFSAPAYAAFATAIVRELWHHDRQPLKLVAVDADNTLWSGVVAEDGPDGVDPRPFTPLHDRLRHCRASGVLLAIISNNDPDMVRAALARPDLPNADEFVAIETGYDSKATRLIGLADRLSLGVDSFCFIDDNEVEVAAMREACPEALAFVLPSPIKGRKQPDTVGGFVRRLWALDIDARTQADRDRPQRYAEEVARRSSRRPGQGHLEFVRSLELCVTPRPLERHLERAAQLSARTNQFNIRKRPRTADELSDELEQPDVRATVLEVRDRFGEYGIVGLVMARVRGPELVVDTLLLSCRVLGRGVELELLRWLAEQADEAGATAVRLLAEPSPRNTPARRFVRRVGDASGGEFVEASGGDLELRVPVTGLRAIGLAALLERVENSSADTSSRRLDIDRRLEARRLAWIARELVRGEDVLRAFGVRWLRPGDDTGDEHTEPAELLSRQIATRMAILLNVPEFSTRTDFLAAGASSLTAVELLADLRRVLGLALTLDDLVAAPTARALAAVAAGIRESTTVARELPLAERMALDAQLAPTLTPTPSDVVATLEPRRVLLTGVTGFVGAHLLFELLRRTDATVVCLIRSRDVEHGWERLRVAIERVDLTWSRALRRRVEILPGDLASPRLGLEADTWRREAEELDAIFHCGALVNFAHPYALLRAVNVEGTRALIELACAERPTPFHHVSTIGVLVGRGCMQRERLDEDALPGPGSELPIGYQQSKWVAERLVLEAGARGLPVAIYRPGTIGPHSTTGSHNHDDLFMLLLRASERLRCLPDIRDLDAAPVDWVVSMIATLARTSEMRGRIVHLVNPNPVPMARVHEWYKLGGSGMRLREFDGWLEDVRADLGDDPEHPLASLRAVLDSEQGREFCRLVNLSPPADCRRATQLAKQLDLPCPVVDAKQLQRWDRRLRAEGLIDDPRDDFGEPKRYMWFREHLVGHATLTDGGRSPLELDLVASVASLRQLLDESRIDLDGTVLCPGIHPHPLHVTEGHWWVRRHAGLGRRDSSEAALMRLRIELVDEDGRELWIEGEKVARPRFDLWKQSRTFELELGDATRTLMRGTAEVGGKTFIEDQVYGVEFRDDVPEAERRRARMLYLAWLGGNVGRTFYDLALRLGISMVTGR